MFKILTQKTETLEKAAFILAFLTLGAQVLAIVRNKIFTTTFGASLELDIYFAAFKIPDMIFLLTGTLISSFILIPFFTKLEINKKKLQNFINKVFFSFLLLIIIISSIVFIFVPQIAQIFFSGFQGDAMCLFIDTTRILLLIPIFFGLANLFIGLNQKYGFFISSALTGVLYNISIILGTLFLFPIFGLLGVIIGVVIGSILYLAVQLPTIFKKKLFPKKILFFSKTESWEILRIAGPRSLALVIADLILVFMIIRAATFEEGSVVIISLVISIFMVPINLIVLTYSSAAFPKMTEYFFQDNLIKFKEFVRSVFSRVFFFGFPIFFFFLFYSNITVGFLLGSEKFAWPEINTTALLISILAFVIIFKSILIILIRIFYAIGKTWFALLSNFIILIIFLIIYYILIHEFFSYHIIEYITEKNIFVYSAPDLILLIFSYSLALILGFLVSIKLFKNTSHYFNLFKNTEWFKKILLSFISVFLSFIFYQLFFTVENNSFFDFSMALIYALISCVIFYIVFSEILPTYEYTKFKKIFLNKIKEFFKK